MSFVQSLRAVHLFLLFAFLASAEALLAQNSDPLNAAIQFNFSNPGARSLAMGGAFTAVADDATAAYTNPAGLVSLSRKEIALELRNQEFRTPYTTGGRLTGEVRGLGIDTVDGLQRAEFGESDLGLSFASFMLPSTSGRWAIGLYRHELAQFQTSFRTEGPFLTSGSEDNRLFGATGELSLEIVNWGASAAIRLPGNVSAGVGISYYQSKLDGAQRLFAHGSPGNMGTGLGEFFGPSDFAGAARGRSVETGDDSSIGANVGLLWQAANGFKLGAAYRQGPALDVAYTRFVTLTNGEEITALELNNELNTPDVYALGFAFRPAQRVSVSLDVNRVMYSQMRGDDFGNVNANPSIEERERYRIDDVTEVRAGLEWTSTTQVPFFVRFGVWHDPAHRISYAESGNDPFARAFYLPGEDVFHYTGGIGISMGTNLELNGAFDYSETASTGALSLVSRF